jgi:hypothetical protein
MVSIKRSLSVKFFSGAALSRAQADVYWYGVGKNVVKDHCCRKTLFDPKRENSTLNREISGLTDIASARLTLTAKADESGFEVSSRKKNIMHPDIRQTGVFYRTDGRQREEK